MQQTAGGWDSCKGRTACRWLANEWTMDNGLEMNGWRDDGVLEGLTMKREMARR